MLTFGVKRTYGAALSKRSALALIVDWFGRPCVAPHVCVFDFWCHKLSQVKIENLSKVAGNALRSSFAQLKRST